MNINSATGTPTLKDAKEEAVYRKVTWRLIPFLLICYIVAYLDRVNVGFAKLQMLDQLQLSEAVYGLGAGIFFLGYFKPLQGAADEHAAIARIYDAMVERALAMGGTCTGEHGIGMGKKGKLIDECGADVVHLMHAIKLVWDPKSILNPGKIFGA